MKQFRKLSALLLALALVLSLVAQPTISAKAATKSKKLVISVSKTITKGDSGKVTIKNLKKGQKVSVAIKNKKILKASKTTFIMGKAGTATVNLKAMKIGKTTVAVKVSTKAKGSWNRVANKAFTVKVVKKAPAPSADNDIADRLAVEKPWLNSSVGDAVNRGYNPDLKDDFYTAANYEKLKTMQLDPTHMVEGTFYQVDYDVENDRMKLLEDKSLTGHDAELVRNLYALYLDWDGRNKVGLSKAKPVVDRIAALKNIDDLTKYFLSKDCVTGISGEGVTVDMADSSKYTVAVNSTSLTLGDSAEYKNRTSYGNMIANYYNKVASYMLGRFGYSEDQIKDLFAKRDAFETKIASSIYTDEESNMMENSEFIHPYTLEELRKASPVFPIADILVAEGMGDSKSYNVYEPNWLKKINELYTDENFEGIKAYLLINVARSFISTTDEEAFRKAQELSNEVNGVSQSDPDEKLALSKTRSMLGTCVAKMYVQKYSSAKVKKDITDMCEIIRDSYRTIIKSQDWMSDTTKEKALEKLEAIRVNAVYPDKWTDYSGLTFKSKAQGGTYQEALDAIGDFNMKQMLKCINQSVDKTAWVTEEVDEVNAYYYPLDNSINIIAGILNGDLYNENMSLEEKFGKIGYVIGHEMSHAFDNSGAQFDKDGNAKGWWTDEDYASFKARSKKLINYYDSMVMFDGSKYSGALVQGEAIADMGGMKAVLTYAKTQPNFDYDKFFKAAADTWCSISNTAYEQMRIARNSHPLNFLRVNTVVQQFDEFYETYNIKKGDGMYLAPEDRVAVW